MPGFADAAMNQAPFVDSNLENGEVSRRRWQKGGGKGSDCEVLPPGPSSSPGKKGEIGKAPSGANGKTANVAVSEEEKGPCD